MIEIPNCFKRKCKHLIGVIQPDGTERTEVTACKAFKDGIPFEIAFGDNKHSKPLKDQGNKIVYERDENWD